MEQTKIRVLYIAHGTSILGGADLSLINLIHSVRNKVYPIVLLRARGPITEHLESMGIEYIIENFRMNIRNENKFLHYIKYIPHFIKDRIINRKCIRNTCNFLKGRNIEIVHSNTSVFTIGVYISKKLKAKHVWHLRETDLYMPFCSFKKLQHMIFQSDASISITNYVSSYYNLSIDQDNTYIIWDAVFQQEYNSLSLKKEHYFVFCAALLSDFKGADFALNAFIKSNLALEGYRLVYVGKYSDSYRSKLDEIADKYNVINNIEYIGYCDNIKSVMADATAFLMCSTNEPMGRVTVEAMLYGCPVIARKSGGSIDLVEHGETGFFFNNEAECASLMRDISKSTPYELIQKANLFVNSHFTEKNYGKHILNVYNKLIL